MRDFGCPLRAGDAIPGENDNIQTTAPCEHYSIPHDDGGRHRGM